MSRLKTTLLCLLGVCQLLLTPAESQYIGYTTTDSSTVSQELNLVRSALNRSGVATYTVIQQTNDIRDSRQALCTLMDQGVTGIIDATTGERSSALLSMCHTHNMPCIASSTDISNSNKGFSSVFNILPGSDIISNASHYLESVLFVGRKEHARSVIVVYDSLDHLAMTEGIITDQKLHVRIVKLEDKHDVHRVVQVLQQTVSSSVVFSLHRSSLLLLLEGITAKEWREGEPMYLLATLDADAAIIQALHSMAETGRIVYSLRLGSTTEYTPSDALLLDATSVLTSALSNTGEPLRSVPNLCQERQQWDLGTNLTQALRQTNIRGVTGHVVYDVTGTRYDVTISMVIYPPTKSFVVASWNSSTNIASLAPELADRKQEARGSRGIRATGGVRPVLRVTTILSEPYTMIASDPSDGKPYEGFCVDLLDRISTHAGFDYELTLVDDASYGSYDANTGEWNGMIGELVHQRVDVAIGDMSVTAEREAAVDFSDSWRSFGIGLLYYKETREYTADWFQFLQPFTPEVWTFLLLAAVMVALLMFVLSRLSPCERNPPPKEDWTPFSLFNSLWFALATLTHQFVVHQPRAASTRLLALFWWLTVIVVVSAYVANWTAFRIADISRTNALGVESIYDLPTQRQISYSAFYEGSTWAFFRDSKLPTMQRLFSAMRNQAQTNQIKNNQKGIERVLKMKGKFAYLMEEPSIEYAVERQCNLVQVGGSLGSRSYAIALRKESEYRNTFNEALFRLQEAGVLEQLRNTWWKTKRGGGKCAVQENLSSEEIAGSVMGMDELAGVFILLAAAAGVAVVLAFCECCWRSASLAREKDESFGGEMALQLQESVSAPFDKEELA